MLSKLPKGDFQHRESSPGSNLVLGLIYRGSVQEGMVFVSMSSSDLLTRTAYQMRDPSPLQESEDLEPLFSDDANESRPLSRRRDSSAQRTVPPPISNSAARSHRRIGSRSTMTSSHPFPLIDLGDDSTPPPQTSIPPEPSDFTVTTSCDDPSSDEEEPSSAATLADRLRRDRLPPPYELSSDEDTEDGLEQAMRRARAMGVPTSHTYYRRSSRRAEPSKIEIVGAADVSGEGGENKGVLVPHARFFIEKTRRYVFRSDPSYSVPSFDYHKTKSRKPDMTSYYLEASSILCSVFLKRGVRTDIINSVVSVKFDPPV